MDYSKLKNDNGLYLYQDDNFSTINMQLTFFADGEDKEEVVRYLLCDYLLKSNKKYNTKNNEINRRMRELYSMNIQAATQKIGSKNNIVFYVDMICPKVAGENYLKEAYELIRNLMLYPDFTNEKILETVKRNYIVDKMDKLSDVNKKAKQLFYVNTFSDAVGKYIYSTDINYIVDVVNSVTLEDLERTYKKVFSEESFYRGIVFGNISEEEFKLFREYFPFKSSMQDLDYSKNNTVFEKKTEVIDENTNESIVYVTYKINHVPEDVSKLLGGILNYSSGLCYRILREKYGLVYSSYAVIFQYTDALTFKAKIDKKNINKLLEAVDEIVGIITNKEKLKDLLIFIKKYIKNEYYLMSEKKDDMFDEIDDYIRGIGGKYSDFIDKIDSYTEEDIIRYTKSMKKANVFIYKGGYNE